jgi:hypothetical protein
MPFKEFTGDFFHDLSQPRDEAANPASSAPPCGFPLSGNPFPELRSDFSNRCSPVKESAVKTASLPLKHVASFLQFTDGETMWKG